ncbi:Mph(E)/Mph(G) family macrolide 2'-phosphotransferase [Sphingobacterium faecale]|uniref:Mph(E)/Mph(G) family macrolide 2'-phosphotransferase n=1 Tax=Sphingobacterium faecale TaxID=2803775 RepID=A0ABS1R2E2_9SPHI|nr:Mph(E)/Mph(G) family macrolide 2'-phosphotransferase [Sphingobacterium faecale]MBL1408719.1 Mph(E)/Mph(G) family macrolide 2'-phosphotransferase [Sphingobacterium faecale]
MTIEDIQILALEHGLKISDDISINEMGIDFRVAFVKEVNGQNWVLRIPRRKDMIEQIQNESRILDLAKRNLSINVPDWKIVAERLIAYPLLEDAPALTFDAMTHEVSWNIDPNSVAYVQSLAKSLAELHRVAADDVRKSNLKIMTPNELRTEIANRIQLVKSEIGISEILESRYRRWLDNELLWPDFTCFIHGDLYAGHVLSNKEGNVSGIIDWSTAHMGDPAMDFSGHLSVFGEDSLKLLITEYVKQGGTIWDKIYEQSIERAAAAPLAYGAFAIECNDDKHISAAKTALGIDQ